jgi:curved DNA-binding protein
MPLQKILKRYIMSRPNKLHPDMEETQNKPNEEKFKMITDAYEILGNKQKKAYYDALHQPINEVHTTWEKTETYDGFYKSTNQQANQYHDTYHQARERSKKSNATN